MSVISRSVDTLLLLISKELLNAIQQPGHSAVQVVLTFELRVLVYEDLITIPLNNNVSDTIETLLEITSVCCLTIRYTGAQC